jgi:hypothetical protein
MRCNGLESEVDDKSTLNQRWRSNFSIPSLAVGRKRVVMEPKRRSIYVLVVWQERPTSPEEPALWRASLEDARTGERYGFAHLEELPTFLKIQMERRGDSGSEEIPQESKGANDADLHR